MHEELVDRRRWIGEGRFLHALNYCMLLPGPEAQQLAIYVGWLLHRLRGGIAAGVFFVLPSFFLMLALSWVYVTHGDVSWVAAILSGLAAAVIGIVAAATLRIGKRALANGVMVAVAVAAFAAIFFAHVPFPLILVGAALIGLVGGAVRPEVFTAGAGRELEERAGAAIRDDAAGAEHTRPSARRSLAVLVVGLAAWLVPLAIVAALAGPGHVLTEEAWFFSRAALVTFGGAYAVLSYIAQAAVVQYGWLVPGQMVVGLGLAETTPGPLIMVTEFVGFVGAYQNPGGLDPLLAGVLGAVVATWATFAPCFLWIFLGAPYVERLRGNTRLDAMLSCITAAVVGAIANLAVWFGIQTLFEQVRTEEVLGGPIPVPDVASVDVFAAVIAIAAFVAIARFRVGILWVVAGSAIAGLVRYAVT